MNSLKHFRKGPVGSHKFVTCWGSQPERVEQVRRLPQIRFQETILKFAFFEVLVHLAPSYSQTVEFLFFLFFFYSLKVRFLHNNNIDNFVFYVERKALLSLLSLLITISFFFIGSNGLEW